MPLSLFLLGGIFLSLVYCLVSSLNMQAPSTTENTLDSLWSRSSLLRLSSPTTSTSTSTSSPPSPSLPQSQSPDVYATNLSSDINQTCITVRINNSDWVYNFNDNVALLSDTDYDILDHHVSNIHEPLTEHNDSLLNGNLLNYTHNTKNTFPSQPEFNSSTSSLDLSVDEPCNTLPIFPPLRESSPNTFVNSIQNPINSNTNETNLFLNVTLTNSYMLNVSPLSSLVSTSIDNILDTLNINSQKKNSSSIHTRCQSIKFTGFSKERCILIKNLTEKGNINHKFVDKILLLVHSKNLILKFNILKSLIQTPCNFYSVNTCDLLSNWNLIVDWNFSDGDTFNVKELNIINDHNTYYLYKYFMSDFLKLLSIIGSITKFILGNDSEIDPHLEESRLLDFHKSLDNDVVKIVKEHCLLEILDANSLHEMVFFLWKTEFPLACESFSSL